jgi:DNA-binding MarR family transcriptional regulator
MAVLGRIYRISRLVGRHIEQHFASFGLDRGEFDVLSTLRRAGPPYRLTPTELIGSLMASSGGMSHRLGRLERAGFILRTPSAHDRRSLLVQLTPEGQALAEEAFRTDMALESVFLDGIPEDEREQMASLLRTLLRSIETREDAGP